MKEIYQLEKRDYKELVEKANLTQSEIEKRAEELYLKNGNQSIILKVRLEQDYEDKLIVKANGYVEDWKTKYPISHEQAKKIMSFVTSRAEELFYKKFDRFIYNYDELQKAKRSFEKRKKTLTSVTILGWVIVFIMFTIIMFK